jgi:ribosomal protein S18 acetylase RimI-like enzyme
LAKDQVRISIVYISIDKTVSPIRKAEKKDLNALKGVIETSGLFPADLLEGMMEDYFNNSSTEDLWLTKEVDGIPVIVSYVAPEKLTDGTYNLYLIAVHKQHQGLGMGAEMMAYVEDYLQSKGKRILLVETSGLPEFERTRRFYDRCQYQRMAFIRDFYKEGEDKIIFWKKLNAI